MVNIIRKMEGKKLNTSSLEIIFCFCLIGLFGIRQYGVSINGYTKDPELGFCLWMQQRSRTKQTWPGKWDNIVSGGLSVGHSVFETALKEADEEASIPPHLLADMKAAGSVS